tara:strand:+ start:172 stop:285 length:114 start_codon:yes stop_codon:yes gene_type:complete
MTLSIERERIGVCKGKKNELQNVNQGESKTVEKNGDR